MEKNTSILRDICIDEYDLKMKDMTVAVLLKTYLQQMPDEAAREQMGRIVSQGVKNFRGGRVRKLKLPKNQWIHIDGSEFASLIDCARAAASISAISWKAENGDRLLTEVIDCLRTEILPRLSGKEYVASMPVEIAEFITDCWLAMA